MPRPPPLPRWRAFLSGTAGGLLSRPPHRPSDTALRRAADLISWNLSHPACREQVHAWRLRRRGQSLVRWRVRRLLAVLSGEAPGRPGWLGSGHGAR